jgi:hypothetical protein
MLKGVALTDLTLPFTHEPTKINIDLKFTRAGSRLA